MVCDPFNRIFFSLIRWSSNITDMNTDKTVASVCLISIGWNTGPDINFKDHWIKSAMINASNFYGKINLKVQGKPNHYFSTRTDTYINSYNIWLHVKTYPIQLNDVLSAQSQSENIGPASKPNARHPELYLEPPHTFGLLLHVFLYPYCKTQCEVRLWNRAKYTLSQGAKGRMKKALLKVLGATGCLLSGHLKRWSKFRRFAQFLNKKRS